MIARAALAMALLLFTAPASFAQTVRIDTGALVGRSGDGFEAFLGIPYAAPPVGALRWRAPQPASAWDGTRRADAERSRPWRARGQSSPPRPGGERRKARICPD